MFILALLILTAGVAESVDISSTHLRQERITVPRGASELLRLGENVSRVAITDTNVANVVVLTPREILVNAATIGNTTLIVWDENDTVRTFTVEVTIDVAALERTFASAFPDEDIRVAAHGNILVLSGTVSGAAAAQQILEIAEATGATVIQRFICIRPSVTC